VNGKVPPLAAIEQPAYAAPWVPPGHEVVVIISGPPLFTGITVTVAAEVVEPEALVVDNV
jgi:hypothetical protein